MTTNYQKVDEFNRIFGVKLYPDLDPNILQNDPVLVEQRMKLIREEMRELEEAVRDNDIVETVDALADILYVVYGAGNALGVNMDEAFRIVHENNMSKLCSTEEEAQETVRYYEENKERLGYDSPDYRRTENGKWAVFNRSTKKVLKSVMWKPVDLGGFCFDRKGQ